jgi:hypothetical protein
MPRIRRRMVAELKSRASRICLRVPILLARMSVPKSGVAYHIERIDSGK